jgi:tetratricopeptide (TPR) repeat protein
MAERRYRALLIGNWEYPDEPGLAGLFGPPTDLETLREALTDPVSGLHHAEDVTVLRNAPVMEIRSRIERFLNSGRGDDQLLIYYSGHGRETELGNDLFLCARDTSTATIRATTVHVKDLAEQVDRCYAAAKVVILDCCYSGNYRHKGGPGATPFEPGDGLAVLTSSQIGELSQDAGVAGQPSPFTRHLVDGLRGAARDTDDDGYLTSADLYDYIHSRMRAEGPQRPAHMHRIVGRIALGRAAQHVATRPAAPDRERSAARLRYALSHVQDNRATALRLLREFSASDDSGWAAPAAMRLGLLAEADGDDETAIDAYGRAAAAGHAELSPEAAFRLGARLLAAGDPERAAEAWRHAAESAHPRWSGEAALGLARLLVATPEGRPAGLRYYRQAAVARGDSGPAALEFGDALRQAGELDEARAVYRRVAALTDPGLAAIGKRRLAGLRPP